MTKTTKYLMVLLTNCLLLGLTTTTAQAGHSNKNNKVDNYKTRYTPEGRKSVGAKGTYRKDTNIWVYTSAFAKRFGMPKEWIDDDLRGAEALAYRLDLDVYGTKCGYFSGQENCRPSTACVLDMYIKDEADLPWNTEYRFGSDYGYKSHGFLVGQGKNDKPTYAKKRITRRGTGAYSYKLGLDRVYSSASDDYPKGGFGSYHILEYDRDIYKNLDYISGSVVCQNFGNITKVKNMTIKIDNPIFHKNGSIKYTYNKKNIAHIIKIPNSFTDKIDRHEKQQYEPNSLFKALRKRLSTTTKPNK